MPFSPGSPVSQYQHSNPSFNTQHPTRQEHSPPKHSTYQHPTQNNMAPSKIIAIVGATGNQGSSVAKVFLNLPGWNVRCVTRQPNSDKANALGALGADLVHADLKDIESLSRAFQGVNAIFVNTSFLEITQTALKAGKDQPPVLASHMTRSCSMPKMQPLPLPR